LISFSDQREQRKEMALVFGDKIVNAKYILWVSVKNDYVSMKMMHSPERLLHVERDETKIFAVVVALVGGSKLVREFSTLEKAEQFRSDVVSRMAM